ncbi:MAG TPA: glycoside hydrolase family 3 C-terminal domain-containing protein [Pyrinomonadaceae bacterium]|nr:glycoside hydrolase family 3 C-terminal domain-containing protein [Pyrinomonadaceae bacterium]
MTKQLALATTVLLLVTSQQLLSQTTPPQLGKNTVAEVVAAMTNEEKALLLVGMGMDLHIPGVEMVTAEDKKSPEKVAGAAGRTHAIPRLGIPSITLSDGPAGVRIDPIRNGDTSKTYYATGFPIGTLLAASWDTSVANRVGLGIGKEAREYGVDVMLAPAMNIHRNPLGGRNFEYYSEDPLLSGMIAAAYVKGVQSNGVGTSIKHFAANNQEFNRMQSNSILSERALREIYLKGFEIAVKEGQPWTVMSSYNLINGTYASQSPELLTTLLRGEWGFKGFVMTDWFGGNDPVAQLQAGNDMLMPGVPGQARDIVSAVENGKLSKEALDQDVTRVLNVILQSPTFKNYKYSNQPDLKAGSQIAREAASEGMVLLKNDGKALPLSTRTRIALLGISSYDLTAGGSGSGDVNKKYVVSLTEGLANQGLTFDDSLRTIYTQYVTDQKARRPKPQPFHLPQPLTEMAVSLDQAQLLANETDVAVFTLGRNSGEFDDRAVENDFTLTSNEHTIIENVSSAFHAKGKKVVVVLNVGGPIETVSWRSLVDAILIAWQPGQEGGNAIADVLTGKVNPSGKLPMTFPSAYSDVPSAKTFPGKELPGKPSTTNNPFGGKPSEALYEEGIYIGYRYYNTFAVKPAYEFGYGLSYTDFSYKDLKLSSNRFQKSVTATVSVINSGKTAGKEVVELYLSAPRQKLSKPESELRAFAKTRLLQPGESQTLTFTLTAKDLASYDPATSAWVAEAGRYKVMVGTSSRNIKQSAPLDLAQDLVVEKSQRLLAPSETIKELQPTN